MPRLPAEYRKVLAESRARLDRLIDRRGAGSVKKVYEDAHADLARKLSRTLSGSMTELQRRSMLAQIKSGEARIAKQMSGAMAEVSRDTQEDSLRSLVRDVRRLEKKFTGAEISIPIEEASRFRGVIDQRRSSLLRSHDSSMLRYGAGLVIKMESELAMSLMTGENTSEAIDRIVNVADNEWWQGERIVRTEVAWAYNATHADGVQAARSDLPDIMMRWSEHVDDATYEPLDARVAVDSIAMHGQLALPNGKFTMPPSAPVADSKGHSIVPVALVGKSWAFPPNRPNDRAVLAPWRPGWGVPGWVWRSGRRVPQT